MEQLLYRKRSISGCISEGYKLYRLNLANILKNTWKEGAAAGMAFGAALVATTRMESPANIIVASISAAAFLTGLFFYKKKVFRMVGENPAKWNMRNALRHSGFILSTAILSGIICVSVFALVCMPLIIVLSTIAMDNNGIASGDPSGLPGYFNILLFTVSSISAFVILHIQVWQTFVSCFVHGAIEERERCKGVKENKE